MEVGLCSLYLLIAIVLVAFLLWMGTRMKEKSLGILIIGIIALAIFGDFGFTGKVEVVLVECHKNLAALAAISPFCPL